MAAMRALLALLLLVPACGDDERVAPADGEGTLYQRLGQESGIRDVIEEELEQAFSGKRSAKSALDQAVKRGNEILRQFERANR